VCCKYSCARTFLKSLETKSNHMNSTFPSFLFLPPLHHLFTFLPSSLLPRSPSSSLSSSPSSSIPFSLLTLFLLLHTRTHHQLSLHHSIPLSYFFQSNSLSYLFLFLSTNTYSERMGQNIKNKKQMFILDFY
jgi:hypothetical protein